MKKAKITALLLAAALLAAGCSGREEAAQAGRIPSSRSEASAPEESALEESDLEESAPEQPQLPGESSTPASGQADRRRRSADIQLQRRQSAGPGKPHPDGGL